MAPFAVAGCWCDRHTRQQCLSPKLDYVDAMQFGQGPPTAPHFGCKTSNVGLDLAGLIRVCEPANQPVSQPRGVGFLLVRVRVVARLKARVCVRNVLCVLKPCPAQSGTPESHYGRTLSIMSPSRTDTCNTLQYHTVQYSIVLQLRLRIQPPAACRLGVAYSNIRPLIDTLVYRLSPSLRLFGRQTLQ